MADPVPPIPPTGGTYNGEFGGLLVAVNVTGFAAVPIDLTHLNGTYSQDVSGAGTTSATVQWLNDADPNRYMGYDTGKLVIFDDVSAEYVAEVIPTDEIDPRGYTLLGIAATDGDGMTALTSIAPVPPIT